MLAPTPGRSDRQRERRRGRQVYTQRDEQRGMLGQSILTCRGMLAPSILTRRRMLAPSIPSRRRLRVQCLVELHAGTRAG